MTIKETGFEGLFILKPKIFEDQRGFFMETYNQKTLADVGIEIVFVQDNHSKSSKGVIRGLHFQHHPYQQAKLVRTLRGSILDVVVDIRKDSPTFGKHYSVEISEENKLQLLIPPGFAHGFVALTDNAQILYKCDQFYNAGSEGGLLYNDPDLAIDWRIDLNEAIISDKDKVNPRLKDLNSTF